MINYASMPSSTAAVKKTGFSIPDIEFTSDASVDVAKLYNDLNKQLTILETSLEIDLQLLNSIEGNLKFFKGGTEEKEEVQMRVNWMRKLYEVKDALKSIKTVENAIHFQNMIVAVQTCPMKINLIIELESLVATLPSEKTESAILSNEELLMEQAIEKAGDGFINLGQVGRDFIIGNLKQDRTIANIKEQTKLLEQKVENIMAITDLQEQINQLEELPLASFTGLSSDRKEKVAVQLFENKTWTNLASLDHMIYLIDRSIEIKEQKQSEIKAIMNTSHGDATSILTRN